MIGTPQNSYSTSAAKGPHAPHPTTRYCCFVIPSRAALFTFSVILCLFGIGFAVVGWVIADELGKSAGCCLQLTLIRYADKQLLEIERLALFFHILVYFLVALFAIVG